MREAVACVPYLATILSLVEMSSKHLLLVSKVCLVQQSVVWHLYHGIHLEARQFKMSKQIWSFDSRHRLPIIANHPGHKAHTIEHLLRLDQMYVGEFLDVWDAVDLILVSVEQIVIAQQEECVIKIIVEFLESAH